MKKVFVIIMSLMIILAFASCKKQQEAETESKQALSHTITGTVDQLEGGELAVFTNSHESVTFNVENIEIDTDVDVESGDKATVKFTGEITGGDTSDCEIESVQITEGERTDIEGEVVSVSKDEITVSGDKELSFDISGISGSEDVAKGDTVSLTYAGVIVDNDTEHAYVKKMTLEKKAKKAEKKPSMKSVDEKVWTTGRASIMEKADDSSDTVDTVKKGTKLKRTGILDNGWSRVTYDKKDCYILSDSLTTKKPKVKEESKDSEESEEADKKDSKADENSDDSSNDKNSDQSDDKNQDEDQNDNSNDGTDNGTDDESADGTDDSSTDGSDNGSTDGTTDGSGDGATDGSNNGATDGSGEEPAGEPVDDSSDSQEVATLTVTGVVTDLNEKTMTLDGDKKKVFKISKAKFDMVADEAMDQKVTVEYTEDTREATHVYFANDEKAADGSGGSSSGPMVPIVVVAVIIAAAAGFAVSRKKSK